MTINKDQVFEVAESISENGNIPSAIKIREILKTGSLGTIQKYLKLWRHKETLNDSLENPPPEHILEATTQYVNNFWGAALHQARKEAMVKIQEAQQDQKVSEKDSETAWEAVEKLENKLSELGVANEQIQIEKEQLLQKISTITTDNEVLHESNNDLSHRIEKLNIESDQKDKKITENNQLIDELKKDNYDYISRNEKLNIENAMNSKDLRSLRENNDKIILQINSEREAKQSLTYDIKIKEEQNRNLKVEISDLKIENNNYKDKSDLQIAELSKLNTQLEFITKQLSESKLEIDNLNIMAKKEISSDLDT